MKFEKLKELHMYKLRKAIEMGEVDKEILFLLNLINKLENYFTTSSCAGRIILLKVSKSGKKNESEFLFKSHSPVSFDEIWNRLLEVYEKIEDYIWFKQDPFILHVSCKDLDSCRKILDISRKSGLKHSGIISISKYRVVIEIQGNERIETIVSKNRKLLVDEEYFKILVEEGNKKLFKTRKNMFKFYNLLLKEFNAIYFKL